MEDLEKLEERVEKMRKLVLELKERVNTLESENKQLFEIKSEVARRIDSIIKKLDLLPDNNGQGA